MRFNYSEKKKKKSLLKTHKLKRWYIAEFSNGECYRQSWSERYTGRAQLEKQDY